MLWYGCYEISVDESHKSYELYNGALPLCLKTIPYPSYDGMLHSCHAIRLLFVREPDNNSGGSAVPRPRTTLEVQDVGR